MNITKLLFIAALSLPTAVPAQQPQQPQPAPQQPQAAPCAPPQRPQLPKGTKLDLPKGLKQMLEKQRQQIQNKTGLTIPSPDDIKQQVQQAAASAPCSQPAPQTPKPPVPPTPATPAPATPVKPTYVCPPKATLIAGYAYCLMPDQSVVDAIPLPPPQPKQ
jgi:hypothetical protein